MKNSLLLSLWMMLVSTSFLLAQEQTVTGTVTSTESDEGIPGVNVIVEGTNLGTVTDVTGSYSINVVPDGSLRFSSIGYGTIVEPVNGRTEINVSLSVDVTELSEVVVTAIGLEKEKKSLGYAVSEVNSEDISTVKQTNVINSLAGRVPGVVMTQSAAGPGAGTRVVIRGNNSITGNNQPLYVVDGIPIDNSGFGSADGSGTGEYSRTDYGTGISDINPDDIESISVLKGPNAAALYGSRAANGVIMITTKKGRANKGLGVTYSSNFTWENQMIFPDYQNEYGQGTQGQTYTDVDELRNSGGSWGARMDGSNQIYWTGETIPYSPQPDNIRDFFRTGHNYINTVALDGGNDNLTTRFSYTNTSSNSILPNAGLNRHNFNLRSFANLTDKLNLDAKVTYFHQEANNRPTQGTEGIMAYVYDLPRNMRIDDLKDFQNDDYSVRTYTNGSNGNPYWILNNDINEDTRDRVYGFAKATYEFTPYLSAFARVGTDVVNHKIETVTKVGHWFFSDGRFNYRKIRTTETNADFLLMFSKDLNESIGLDINLGGNHRYNTFESIGIFGEDFKLPTKWNVANAGNTDPSYTPLREQKINSLYGSVQLAYNNTFYLDFSARNDWSSTLSPDNWSYFYPSASASVLLNEIIDPAQDVFDFWKVRASWAQVGNDTGPYQLRNTFNLVQDGYLGLTTLNRPSLRLNPDLQPEQISTFEIGTEVRFFNNRLYADFSYYDIASEDLILDVPISEASGYSRFRTNVGKITNKGVELMIGGIPFQTADFSWDISLNMARNRNELVELIEGVDNFIFTTTNNGAIAVQATVGGGFGDIYGTTWETNEAGEIVVDAAGRPIATSEKVLLGNYQPDWIGGLSNTFTYKNFNMRVLIDGRIGGEIFSGTDAGLDGAGVTSKTLQYRESGITVDGVVNTGTSDAPVYETNTTQITGQQYWGAYAGIASNYVYEQTNFRLRELSISYRLPNNVLSATPFNRASIGLIGRNLFFISKDLDHFDPETSFSTSNFAQGVLFYNMPTTRQYGFSIDLSF